MDAIVSRAESRIGAELWQSLADNIPQLAWVADADGFIFWYNRRWYDYTGTDLASMEGWGWKAVHHPDEVERVEQRFRSALTAGEPWEDTFPLRGADGAYRQFLGRASPLRGASGAITHWFGTNTDVTEQQSALRRDNFLLRLEEILRQDRDPDAAKNAATRLLGTELRADRVSYTDASGNGFVVRDQYVAPGVPLLTGLFEGPGFLAAMEGFRSGTPIVTADVRLDMNFDELLRGDDIVSLPLRAVLAVPILVAGRLIAILAVHQLTVREWSGEEIDLVTRTAERMSEAVARAVFSSGLERSEARLARATRAAGMFAWEIDPQTSLTTWGEGAAEILGVRPDDLKSDGLFFVDENDRKAIRKNVTAAMTEQRSSVIAEFRGSDGRHWRAEMAIVYAADGAVTKAVGVTRDISEEVRGRDALRASEAQFRTVAEALPGILFIADAEGSNSYVNRRYRDYSGLGGDQLLGDGWSEIIHHDDLSQLIQLAARAREVGSTFQGEYRLRRADGTFRWHLTQAAPVHDANGVVERWVGVSIDIHDQREAEDALRQSEERYRTLFVSMSQGFFIVQVEEAAGGPVEYRIIEINPAFTTITGFGAEVVGQSMRETIPGLEEVWYDCYDAVVRTGQPRRFVGHAAPVDRWFEIYAFRTGATEDRQVAILFADVTERLRQQEALRQSEQDMRMRLNAIPQMVWSTLPDGFHDFYNDRWYEFTGTPLGSTDGDGWNAMFHPEDQAGAWERWRHSLATGEPYEIEYRLRHHNGTYRWVLGRALPIRDEAGAILRWMGTCTDIDDRIAADRALRSSEARMRALFDAMPVGLVFADAAGRITDGNRQVEQIIGQDVAPTDKIDDFIRDHVAFHADGRKVESAEYPLAQIIAGERGTPELECQVQRPDGSTRWVRYVGAPILEDGTLAGGVVASLDIDREKRLTESLEREVERVVAEREMAQEALRQSQKLESMGQLTGGVAHDFNNLLTPIIGSLDLLRRKQIMDERTARLVDGALASAEKARVLVQRLLAFARRQPLQPRAVDLGSIVAEMSELIASTSGPRVRVEVDVAPHLPPALADGNQLEMALLNLSVNARDAMPDGGSLTIALRAEDGGAGRRLGLTGDQCLVLSVSDTGLGMDEETRRRAIEPFFSTKGIGKGTGLGLSMVHGLAAQLGGALDMRSAPGVGTTIELWLPVADATVAAQAPEADVSERHGAGTALLVDDEELVRAATAAMLSDLGFQVIEVASGEEALARCQAGLVPDVLVTDQLMPGISGTDLAGRLRQALPDMPVLIASGYADLDSLSPAYPHLSKPFRQSELAEAMEQAGVKVERGGRLASIAAPPIRRP